VPTLIKGVGIIQRGVKAGRVVSALDGRGVSAQLRYRPNGSLLALNIQSNKDEEWVLTYNLLGKLASIRGPSAFPAIAFRYDEQSGNLVEYKVDNAVTSFERNGLSKSGEADTLSSSPVRICDQLSQNIKVSLRKLNPFRNMETMISCVPSLNVTSVKTLAGRIDYERNETTLTANITLNSKNKQK